MFCKNCGKELNDNVVVCLNCGVMTGVGNKYCEHCGFEPDPMAVICVKCGCELKRVNNHLSISDYKTDKPRLGHQSPFMMAFQTCFKKYAVFRGRANKAEFWYFALFYGLLMLTPVVLSVIGWIGDACGWSASYDYRGIRHYDDSFFLLGSICTLISIVFNVAVFLPLLSVTIRRLHDTGRSGKYCCLLFIPIVGMILMLVCLCEGTDLNDNEYGLKPENR